MRLKPAVRPLFSVPLRLLVCTTLIVGVGFFTVVAHDLTRERIVKQTNISFAEITDSYIRQLTQHMEGYGDLLYATRGLFATAGVNNTTWPQFIQAQYTFQRYPGMKAIAYAEVVPEQQQAAYVSRVRSETKNVAFAVHPAATTGDRVVVTYLQEEDPAHPEYTGAAGFGLMSEPVRRAALEQARASGQIAATAPLHLVESNKPGFLLVLPFANTTGVQGYSVAAFDVASLIDKTVGPHLQQYRTSITLTDISGSTPEQLFSKASGGSGNMVQRAITLKVGDRRWRVSFEAPSSSLQMATDRLAAPAVLVGGLILILAVAIGFYSLRIRNQLRCSITS